MLDPVMTMTRQEALDRLNDFGIQGENIYLIDLIPLVEIIWSDGYAQSSELAIFKSYLSRHVDRINGMAGYRMMTVEKAERFLQQYLKEKPTEGLLATLRSLLPPLRLNNSDNASNDELRESLLQGCLDIAASSVTHYPYEAVERFCASEKKCWFEIFDTLNGIQPKQPVSVR
jgi:hypothetical protein